MLTHDNVHGFSLEVESPGDFRESMKYFAA